MFSFKQHIAQQLEQLKDSGNYRYFLEVSKSATHFPRFTYTNDKGEKHAAINWCSNDYLGLSGHEAIISKMCYTGHMSGAGSGGTRNISGTTHCHAQLEHTVAQWHKKEAALIFNSAYMANLTALQTLGRKIPGLIFISDQRNHASIIEGIRSSGAEKIIFHHNDTDHLEQILKALPPQQPKCVVFESVYSMNGNIAPVATIAAIAKQYGAITYLDEVHAVGLYGPQGAGMAAMQDAETSIDIINGTFSKALGVFGGYIAADSNMIDFVRSFGSGFIFTTSLPPAICAAVNTAIELVKCDASSRYSMHETVALLRKQLLQAGIPFIPNESHITCVPVGNAKLCRRIAALLLEKHGIYLQPINYPTVPKGEECLRIIATAKHQSRQINHLVYSLQKVWSEEYDFNRTQIEALSHSN